MSFWDELKDRKLVQWGLGYIAFGIAVLEILNAVETPWGLSNALVRVCMVVVAAGFGVTLVLAWFHGERGRQRVGVLELFLLLLVVGVAGLGATLASRPESGEQKGPAERLAPAAPGATAASAVERNSIAVLPFTNLSGDPKDEYFTQGIAEELTNALGSIPGLRVASRTSAFQFQGQRTDVREVGRKLGVAAVLEGSIQRAGGKVRLVATLVDAASGYQLWSERVDADATDIFAAEDRISRAVADALKLKLALAREPTENARVTDTVAHQSYLRGRYLASQDNPAAAGQAEKQYREAMRRDPNFAPAYAGLAESFLSMGHWGMMKPQAAKDSAWATAQRAVDLDSTLPQAHVALARAADRPDVRVRELQRALALNPNLAEAQAELARALAEMGRSQEALRQARHAARNDPFGHGAAGLADVFVIAGHADSALQALRGLPTPPDAPNVPPPPVMWRGGPPPDQAELNATVGMRLTGNAYTRAAGLELLEKARAMGGSRPQVLAYVALGQARAGQRDQAVATLGEYERAVHEPIARARTAAAVYGALGDMDAAFERLDVAARENPRALHAALSDSLLAPLRADPRFAALQQRTGG